jgi:hypothetical protein
MSRSVYSDSSAPCFSHHQTRNESAADTIHALICEAAARSMFSMKAGEWRRNGGESETDVMLPRSDQRGPGWLEFVDHLAGAVGPDELVLWVEDERQLVHLRLVEGVGLG